MTRRWVLWTRVVGALVVSGIAFGAGRILWPDLAVNQFDLELGGHIYTVAPTRFLVSLSFGLFGLGFGYILAPTLVRPVRAIAEELQRTPAAQVIGATAGLAFGLFLSALLALPLRALPDPFGQYLPFIVALTLAYFGATLGGSDPDTYLGPFRSRIVDRRNSGRCTLLDTSVIIDGRVADVAETGFLTQTLVVPRFVLSELQQIADSSDPLRRNRGRRGLDMLNRLQRSETVRVEISDRDPGGDDVDRKLIRLAEELDCPIMTNDFNLNRVAEIQGRRVLNLNELANAVKTLLLPGETIQLEIIQEGKEFGQGVGYLDDGTMVVVEGGRGHIGRIIPVSVSRVLQTVAGRMVFATPVAVTAVGEERQDRS